MRMVKIDLSRSVGVLTLGCASAIHEHLQQTAEGIVLCGRRKRKKCVMCPAYRRSFPKAQFFVHNHVQPQEYLGLNGFRAWLCAPEPRYTVCKCDWAAGRGFEHYEVDPIIRAENYKNYLLKEGVAKEQIAEKLLEGGWSKEQIEQLANRFPAL